MASRKNIREINERLAEIENELKDIQEYLDDCYACQEMDSHQRRGLECYCDSKRTDRAELRREQQNLLADIDGAYCDHVLPTGLGAGV